MVLVPGLHIDLFCSGSLFIDVAPTSAHDDLYPYPSLSQRSEWLTFLMFSQKLGNNPCTPVKEPCPGWACWHFYEEVFQKQIDWLKLSRACTPCIVLSVVLVTISRVQVSLSWLRGWPVVMKSPECVSVSAWHQAPGGWHHLGLTMAITFVTLLTGPPGATAGARIDFHTLFTNKTGSLRYLRTE